MKNICIIGTGYVGLVSGAGMADFGNSVICADIDTSKIDMLQDGGIPIYEPGLKELVERNVNAGRLSFSTDIAASVKNAEVVFIAVGTPMGDNGEADLKAVEAVATTIAKNLNGYKIICTKSTVPVGTGARLEALITREKESDYDFDVVSNPEFLREGSAVKDFLIPDRVVLGVSNEHAGDVMQEVYRSLFINETPIVVTNVPSAEMIKYASNAFLAVKISFINEMANLADKVGADVHTIARAMGLDGRISSKFLHPGPGYGGSCFPKDTEALVYTGEQYGVDFQVVKAAIGANKHQRDVILAKARELLPELKSKTVAILGLAFKANTDDVRDSPALEIIQGLEEAGAIVKAYDPIASENMKKFFLPDLDTRESVVETVTDADLVIILTPWNELRGLGLEDLKEHLNAPNIVDARNVLSVDKLKEHGYNYRNVGRSNI
ncbi:MAG: UDP-glucose/GDP-mannose dehydrogenase family protein [Candidatus Marinimicrobia bacterium]|jgi:UDPglucose 6-dehydrogenase|nr:UDP-glucose/GDP-mannose dehydrogenase family protein [Candidatus Neomarinimicrobiota bacterium]MBT3631453.1 UDP-glucose/GDP-mannose dehydrogenase family protein [Candidatus Neomarinimicrobiota bacterium]MBT3825452.1 UDP-glucose/GDP-mannose dehydrogenase family protein [Candidatus Neomarinimicrobiota bacterium]MBT4131553.1 UDP-glucose/GDP-mannose dehydrogenase family protein [Candidatus Neomarinimicrobiota bacterium]MBT4294880.1 UDP-glucose/GDP-mannose dehydrogenase family protein [Candidatus